MSSTKVLLPVLVLLAGVAGVVMAINGGVGQEPGAPAERTVHVTARKFTYLPDEITLKRGEPVILEFTTEDVLMGFNVPELGLRARIVPGQVTRLRFIPQKAGTFPFHCDIFCGSGHEDMTGTIVVQD